MMGKTSKKYIFCSPKASGTTLVALNMAICHQFLEMDLKVAYLQLSPFPDAHVYANISNERTIFDIKNFLDKKELPKNLLFEVAQKNGVDCFQSPKKKHWKDLARNNIRDIVKLLEREYDTIYIDLSLSLDEEILEDLFMEAQKIVVISFLSPPNLTAMESFFQFYEKFLPKVSLLFNQCPSESDSLIKSQIKNREIGYLGSLPIEEKYMWEQVFESSPLAFQKKSKWSRALLEILKKMIRST